MKYRSWDGAQIRGSTFWPSSNLARPDMLSFIAALSLPEKRFCKEQCSGTSSEDGQNRLYRIFAPENKGICICRHADFETNKEDIFPEGTALLDCISREIAEDTTLQTPHEDMENQPIQAYIVHFSHLCLKSQMKHYPRLPKSFSETCIYPRRCIAIDSEYNAHVDRGTWTYLPKKSWMKTVPFTRKFKLKTLDTSGKEFLKKVRCCLRREMLREQWGVCEWDAPWLYFESPRSIFILLLWFYTVVIWPKMMCQDTVSVFAPHNRFG